MLLIFAVHLTAKACLYAFAIVVPRRKNQKVASTNTNSKMQQYDARICDNGDKKQHKYGPALQSCCTCYRMLPLQTAAKMPNHGFQRLLPETVRKSEQYNHHTMTMTTTMMTTMIIIIIYYYDDIMCIMWHGNQSHSLLQYCWLLVQSCAIMS